MSLFKRKPSKPRPRPQPLRHGVLFQTFKGEGWANKGQIISPVIEVSEWETLNGLSRITIDRITGHGGLERQVREMTPNWVRTADVQWRADA